MPGNETGGTFFKRAPWHYYTDIRLLIRKKTLPVLYRQDPARLAGQVLAQTEDCSTS